MVLNFCFQAYTNDKSQSPKSQFTVAQTVIDFEEMTETIGVEVRKIRRVHDDQIRIREEDSYRVKEIV